MKKILRLNEEFNNVKLIQVNDGFVVVDILANPHKYEYSYDFEQKKLVKNTSDWNTTDFYWAIIFATPNINLEGVPVIDDNARVLANNSWEGCDGCTQQDELFYKNGYIKGYNRAQQKLFSEEEIKEAIEFGRQCGLYDGNCHDKRPEFYDENDKFIQSLKLPKVEITFEDGKPIKCIMI